MSLTVGHYGTFHVLVVQVSLLCIFYIIYIYKKKNQCWRHPSINSILCSHWSLPQSRHLKLEISSTWYVPTSHFQWLFHLSSLQVTEFHWYFMVSGFYITVSLFLCVHPLSNLQAFPYSFSSDRWLNVTGSHRPSPWCSCQNAKSFFVLCHYVAKHFSLTSFK